MRHLAALALLAIPTAPAWRHAWRWGPGHVDLLWPSLALLVGSTALTALASPSARVRAAARLALVVALCGVWSTFWWVDLRHAAFAWTLVGVVVAAWAGALAAGERGAVAGGSAALAGVWALMLVRADNGCTGVSAAYGTTQALTALLLFGLGPLALDLRIVAAAGPGVSSRAGPAAARSGCPCTRDTSPAG